MKKTKLFLGALSLLAFAACSDDKNAPAPEQELNDGTKSFITVRIMDAFSQGSRADGAKTPSDYENGGQVTNGNNIYEESVIKSLTIAFYDINKNFITFGTANNLDIKPNQTTGGNLETISEAEVELTLKPNDPTPAYAIAFANPLHNQPSLTNISATQTSERDKYWTSVTADNKTTYYFAMNNSIYFSHPGHELQVAVPVQSSNFYKSDASAEQKTKAGVVDFYIERVASKVILQGPDASTGTITVENAEAKVDGTDKILVFVPEKWNLNAIEKSTNLMKNFTQDFSTLQTNLASWGNRADGTPLWNDHENKRSYWTHSRTFSAINFPDVSDDVNSASANYPLSYISYKSMKDGGATIGSCQYTFENTKQKASFNKNSALISAVIVGHYEIRSSDASTTATTPESFYRRAGAIYTVNGFWSAMASTQQVIMKQKSSSETSVSYEALSATELKAITEIDHPKQNSFGDKVTENLVTIKLKESASMSDYYIRDAAGNYAKYSDFNLPNKDEDKLDCTTKDEYINKLLLIQCGLLEAYTDGKAYFNIPIEHLGKKEDGNPLAGYYGVVRNHTYVITVDKIMSTAFATGVFDETFPIVPPTITDKYNFKANLKVHAWRMVRKNVTLK